MTRQTTKQTLIEVGTKSPLWVAQSNQGEVSISEYLGQTAILLLFYASDWNNVCGDELSLLEDLIKLAGPVRLKAFGISADNTASHKAFAQQLGLQNVTLLSDQEGELSRAYGLPDTNHQNQRATILIDPAGIIRRVEIAPVDGLAHPVDEMESALQQVREWSGLPSSLEEWRHERQHIMQLEREAPLPTPTKWQLSFWGTRGSIPVSGPGNMRYGGNTSCVSLTSDTGHLFIFDCGSGLRKLGNYLLSPEWAATNSNSKNISGYILISHTHWDHIQGFPFFVPVFKPGNRFNIIGPANCSRTLVSALAGQMEQIYFPVSLHALPSSLAFYPIQYGDALLDGVLVRGQVLKHPLPSIAYRLEFGGKVIVYATDHEPHSVPVMEPGKLLGDNVVDKNLVKLAQNADILIHDAQYSVAQLAEKVGWGHNSSEVGVDTATKAGVKKLILYHHDPEHDDEAIDRLLAAAYKRAVSLGNTSLEIIAASDGMQLDLS